MTATVDGAAPRRAWVAAPGQPAGTAGRYWRFAGPRGAAVAWRAADVAETLERVEEATRRGLWAVGSVAYEAAPGLDPALAVRPREGVDEPLAAFSFFPEPELVALPAPAAAARVEAVRPLWSAERHAEAVAAVRSAIARGETYQVNLTFPMRGQLVGDPFDLFLAAAPAAGASGATFLEDERRAIVSLSPELFFERAAGRVRMRPMKGTRPRGRTAEEDAQLRAELASSEKERAENLMIVDMARNDLGRIARPGSVTVSHLLEIEAYPTVWQTTSTITATSEAPLVELFRALFPCCSVTGAPKAATMGWIARLETAPRGVYCGAIGWAAPDGRARFAVGIRTALVERRTGDVAYGVGSGIVWDSDAEAEWRECLVKARALDGAAAGAFGLFETLLWRPGEGAPLAARHIARLAGSAGRLGLACPAPAEIAARLAAAGAAWTESCRVRLELDAGGSVSFVAEPFRRRRESWRLRVAGEPVDPEDRFLFHKTTWRGRYDAALAAARAAGADEALLENVAGELTEGARTNLVVEIEGRRFTPRWESGLLPGVLRGRLLAGGRLAERAITRDDLARATRVWAINALRGATRVVSVDDRDGRRLWSAF